MKLSNLYYFLNISVDLNHVKIKFLKFKNILKENYSLDIYKNLTRNNDNEYISFDFQYEHNLELLEKIWSSFKTFEDKMMIADVLLLIYQMIF